MQGRAGEDLASPYSPGDLPNIQEAWISSASTLHIEFHPSERVHAVQLASQAKHRVFLKINKVVPFSSLRYCSQSTHFSFLEESIF